jgi:hypothetical protein
MNPPSAPTILGVDDEPERDAKALIRLRQTEADLAASEERLRLATESTGGSAIR